ncbi:MAG: non-heme iron oxygenase ferredoxin subunit [Mobiluncus porci]|uniref:Non-heme iron oxygenase ferredoxin subunit n=1 Tax=Mobiluncus porci TaxID=2652278 RepID=A0A7K0K017_9ACTO|nr:MULTISPECIES: non-heme iron oxygenase ferredoxin subunit [Mobiluncus]MCI6585272.1 non-heme iron oxygenase ferredoxin subunit [Mobiluncus sp.]MDD7541517.1 non-heme iron oxygenase ferredoxin subunit [Mobiluncus porci]MDY5748502.1 non-heme iron oxygenase ferredoxin subunit [Mobiluncus porci]MST48738.1 non-heme iron oxygenase ferredoxin subunit [Mobiluncus porci]
MSFINAVTVDEIEPGTGKTIELEGQAVAVLRDDAGNFYAMDDACPHAGYTMSEGEIDDGCVECFAHGARFDLVTGEPDSPAHEPLAMYPVEVDGDVVKVDLHA